MPAWIKGQSGNPKGRPKKNQTLKDAIKRQEKDSAQGIVDRVYALLDNPKSDAETRLKCCAWLRDTAWGKPIPRRMTDLVTVIQRAFTVDGTALIDVAARILVDSDMNVDPERARALALDILQLPEKLHRR